MKLKVATLSVTGTNQGDGSNFPRSKFALAIDRYFYVHVEVPATTREATVARVIPAILLAIRRQSDGHLCCESCFWLRKGSV